MLIDGLQLMGALGLMARDSESFAIVPDKGIEVTAGLLSPYTQIVPALWET